MPSAAAADADPVRATPRHQIYGDPAIMETLERGEFGKVLPREGDRLLAIFAQPGKLMCGRGMSPQDLAAEQCAVLCAYANGQLAAEHDIKISPASHGAGWRMRLEVPRNGTKLFFITFAVKGRRPKG